MHSCLISVSVYSVYGVKMVEKTIFQLQKWAWPKSWCALRAILFPQLRKILDPPLGLTGDDYDDDDDDEHEHVKNFD